MTTPATCTSVYLPVAQPGQGERVSALMVHEAIVEGQQWLAEGHGGLAVLWVRDAAIK